jgi:hypothetical protein
MTSTEGLIRVPARAVPVKRLKTAPQPLQR